MSLLYDEQDPWKGWTIQDVYQMSEKQLRDFCRETMIMPSSEIPSHDLRVAVWKKLLSSKAAPSELTEQSFAIHEEGSLPISKSQLIEHLSMTDQDKSTLSESVVEKTFKILVFHHQYMAERAAMANSSSSNNMMVPPVIPNILSYRPEMARFVYQFIRCINVESMPCSELYPMVFVMLTRYFKPLESKNNPLLEKTDSEQLHLLLDCFDQMFRLLLQYHDPELQIHFDRHRLEVIVDEIIPWSKSLLVDLIIRSSSNFIEIFTYFLDILIIERDPVIFTFFVIAILMRDRTNLLNLTTTNELRQYCKDALSSSSTSKQQIIVQKSDISSLYLEVKNLEKETPLSARNQLLSLFQASAEVKFDMIKKQLQESVILPIPTSEIVDCFTKDRTRQQQRAKTTSVKYIIIDCRSVKSFQYARLPTAIHIGTRVGYDDEKMKAILQRFQDAKGSHFIIFGTGRKLAEEENLLRVIAMKFVTATFSHVSIAIDGFKGCIKFMTSNQIEYVKDETVENANNKNTSGINTEEWAQKVSSFITWGKKMAEEFVNENKDKVPRLGASLNKAKSTLESKIKPVFSLGEEGSGSDDDDLSNTSAVMSGDSSQQEPTTVVKIDELSTLGENIALFTAQTRKTHEPRYIVLGDNLIMCLKPHPQILGSGLILWKRTLRQIVKLSFKKTDSTSLSFTLKGYPNTLSYVPQPHDSSQKDQAPASFVEQLSMEKAQECIELVQRNIQKLKENK
ncbi:hypothetical protein C9374_011172 [Naegleria lovaniensis]|uniref:Rhodanese domain-containing protein n=1 Tax=Naegleria lovaniensis TaxID=51637 RepID=A0AA88GF81_NAELO|nr:uncharacterized protein C9374_011172 [Naegleria lovaniensis]KAG2374093.1 hypothetical protein C9374_011172 [Naegleria lovaniensis]